LHFNFKNYLKKKLCPTLAHKKTNVNWDEPKEFNPLKNLTPKVKPKKKFNIFLPPLPTYLNIDFNSF